MEGITSVDYRHARRVYKEFEINNLGEYHDLYVQSDYWLKMHLNLGNKCIEIYKLILLIFYQHLD